ncbi:GtrA family protein [Patescibacteria group bacterium]|nr:GtrA family protein [Patescibacteria group bacterium]
MRHLIFGRARSTHIQFLRYFFVGGSSAVLDLLTFALIIEYTSIHYLVAALIAYMCGLIWNYVISIIWVFDSRHKRWVEFLMVFLIALGGLFWTELLLWIFVEYVHIIPMIAKIIALWIVLLWNFGMRKVYVFH